MTSEEEGPYHIARHAHETPQRPALVMGASGETVTFQQLNRRSRRLARYLSAHGIARGDHIAVMMENNADFFTACWAAQRLGLIYTPINWHLTGGEAAYIVENCGAKALIMSDKTRHVVTAMAGNLDSIIVALTTGQPFGEFKNLNQAIDSVDDGPDIGRCEGDVMFYSSGTTGRPKGITPKRGELAWGQLPPLTMYLRGACGLGRDTVYLVPAPLYHAAALVWSMIVLRAGGLLVVMEKFDPREALRLIGELGVTHAQFVPTMFVRMLRLSPTERNEHDLSSLKIVIHAAAPCSPQIKQQVINWFGPIVHEYYAGSEGNGLTAVDSATWLAHRGTVGKPVFGQIHVVGDEGEALPAGQDGLIYFSGGTDFEYYRDPDKTASAFNARGWSTLGDIGHIDEEGFLYLSDRRTDLIISGGVNIYPKETEDVLLQHPSVIDVAVIGVPHDELGQEVKAIVELSAGTVASPKLADDMIAFCRERIAAFKCPKSIDFAALPRLPNGKMLKRELRDRYLKPGL
jgi:long-chain acyl-CoA synthetase